MEQYIQNSERQKFQPRIPYPVKLSFRYNGEIKAFPDEQKLGKSIVTRSPLQEMIKKALKPQKRERIYKD